MVLPPLQSHSFHLSHSHSDLAPSQVSQFPSISSSPILELVLLTSQPTLGPCTPTPWLFNLTQTIPMAGKGPQSSANQSYHLHTWILSSQSLPLAAITLTSKWMDDDQVRRKKSGNLAFNHYHFPATCRTLGKSIHSCEIHFLSFRKENELYYWIILYKWHPVSICK